MKTTRKTKRLTFGDFVATVYGAVGKRKARKVVRAAVNTGNVGFRGALRFTVS